MYSVQFTYSQTEFDRETCDFSFLFAALPAAAGVGGRRRAAAGGGGRRRSDVGQTGAGAMIMLHFQTQFKLALLLPLRLLWSFFHYHKMNGNTRFTQMKPRLPVMKTIILVPYIRSRPTLLMLVMFSTVTCNPRELVSCGGAHYPHCWHS